MSPWSVRARLTGLVVLVALLLGVVAATFGVDQIGQELISGDLDEAADNQLSSVTEALAFGNRELVTEVSIDEAFDGDGQEVSLGDVALDEIDADGEAVAANEFDKVTQLRELARSLGDIIERDAFGELLDAVEYEPGDTITILTYFGTVAFFDPQERSLDGPDAFADDDDLLVPQSVIDELQFLTTGFDVKEALPTEAGSSSVEAVGVADKQVDVAAVEPSGLVFDTRRIDGLAADFVIFTDASDAQRGLTRVRTLVWVGLPLLVLFGGLLAWLLTGRALRPVHAITTQVGAISTSNLHERVPQPSTGDEVAELAATMNSMLDRLEIDDRRLRQFVSDASHELRSPVAVLRSEAEVAKRAPDATSIDELADGVLIESARLQRIVEDLLVLARGEERQMSGLVDVDVDDIVLDEAGRRRALPVDTRSVSAGRVLGSPDAVRRIITHLLDNAARHGTSRIEIGVVTDDNGVRLWVDDDGPGVPDADRGRIFERFARLDDARTRDQGGAGLGLAVVAESVRVMRGQVTIETAPLGGARFVVRWPVT
ncbi:MAG: ATP-binding protein [Actinomycetota bacterium]